MPMAAPGLQGVARVQVDSDKCFVVLMQQSIQRCFKVPPSHNRGSLTHPHHKPEARRAKSRGQGRRHRNAQRQVGRWPKLWTEEHAVASPRRHSSFKHKRVPKLGRLCARQMHDTRIARLHGTFSALKVAIHELRTKHILHLRNCLVSHARRVPRQGASVELLTWSGNRK
jgi:hypothetical protein